MEKVKLRKEIANLLQIIRDDGFSDYALIGMLYVGDKNYDPIHWLGEFMGQGSDKMHPDDLVKALVNGYEVEETPEDKVWNYYRELLQSNNDDGSEAVRTVLKLLGKEVRGINS